MALTDTSDESGSGSSEGSAMAAPIWLNVELSVILKQKLPKFIEPECRVAGWDPEVSLEYLSTVKMAQTINWKTLAILEYRLETGKRYELLLVFIGCFTPTKSHCHVLCFVVVRMRVWDSVSCPCQYLCPVPRLRLLILGVWHIVLILVPAKEFGRRCWYALPYKRMMKSSPLVASFLAVSMTQT